MTEEELEMFIEYIIFNRTEDVSLDETLDDIKEKAMKWGKAKNEIIK